MEGNLISRRKILAGFGAALVTVSPLTYNTLSNELNKQDNPIESSRDYSFSFTTYIIGKEWLSDKVNNKEIKFKGIDNWDIKKSGSFTTFDFFPKELVLADLYKDEKLIAENIKAKNLYDFFIPRTAGKARIKIDFRSPIGNKTYNEEVNFLNDQEIFDTFLESYDSQKNKPDITFHDIENKGNTPRSFLLKVQEKPVGIEYKVYGIEGLIDIDSKEMLNFWKYRKYFDNIQDYRNYIKEYDSSEFKIHIPEFKINK